MTKNEIVAKLRLAGVTVKNVSNTKVSELQELLATTEKTKPVKRRVIETIGVMDARYDVYLKALPKLVRDVVPVKGLDPRQVYYDYRKLGREQLIATYA